jgi:hypothetical protein
VQLQMQPTPVQTPPSTLALATDAAVATLADAGKPEPSSLRAEVVEAHTIRVRTLRAITLEARELRVKTVRRVSNYPVAKDEGMVKLEGNVVQADELEAHHVVAEVVIADEVIAHRVTKPHGVSRWASSEGTADVVVNRCVHLGPRSDGVVARCARGLAFAP